VKFNISKEWCEKSAKLEGDSEVGAGIPPSPFEMWFAELTLLARKRGLEWLIGNAESHRSSFADGNTPEQELDTQIAEATRHA
jgi:hypothetical protein